MEFDRPPVDANANNLKDQALRLDAPRKQDTLVNGIHEDDSIPEEFTKDDPAESSPTLQENKTSPDTRHVSRDRSNTVPSKQARIVLQPSDTNSNRRLTSIDTSEAKRALRQEVLKLSPAQIQELTSDSGSLPIRVGSPVPSKELEQEIHENVIQDDFQSHTAEDAVGSTIVPSSTAGTNAKPSVDDDTVDTVHPLVHVRETKNSSMRPKPSPRSYSTPSTHQRSKVRDEEASSTHGSNRRSTLSPVTPLDPNNPDAREPRLADPMPSPTSTVMPIPPFSMPTHLQLELSSERPSQLYIQSSHSSTFPYESSTVKFERLLNFLRLPPLLEQVLWFGALTCLDAWLYTFTILPLRFMKALWVLFQWAVSNVLKEIKELAKYILGGSGRIWHRFRTDNSADQPLRTPQPHEDEQNPFSQSQSDQPQGTKGAISSEKRLPRSHRPSGFKHRRSRSTPSSLMPNHKADLLQGCLIIASCLILTRFDASRMYHGIRGQAAIKLYVIYNVIEVFDRLLSALGQDILECLFSQETLERKPNGRSKISRPIGMFLLALVYTVVHATALFYQVVTLNVAVNSYSNALLTLLMSNQFVEIKGTVFKKFEKENLFQLTCADVVERFQLWLMLLIIALRNIVEVGGLSINLGPSFTGPSSTSNIPPQNASSGAASGILPKAFTFIPSQLPFQVLGPFVMVLGSEMAVDWIKHAYIAKFNATKPAVYGRFFDVLAKDYYSNAFAEQNLTKRLGLPVIPLACLFIRATLQTYHMFLATNVHAPMMSTATSLSLESEAVESPVFAQLDKIFRRALGRSSFGGGGPSADFTWTLDDFIALATMLIFFLVLYLLLLAFKLALGMILLSVARDRYKGMKSREEQAVVDTASKRVGGWGTVEVSEDKRRTIYDADEDGLRRVRERDARTKEKENKATGSRGLDSVDRYTMVAKRIW